MRLLVLRLDGGAAPGQAVLPYAGRVRALLVALIASVALSGCWSLHSTTTPSEGHIVAGPKPAGEIPAPVRTTTFAVPAPKPTVKPPTYSVVVNDVPVKELLQALARDTRQNIDIHPGLTGLVSINAINETLPAILDRISKQVNMRVRREGNTIIVQPDTPYIKTYRVNYVNMVRDSDSRIGVSGSISTTGAVGGGTGGSGGGGGGGGDQGGNQSQTTVNTRSQNHFWEVLQTNIRSILGSTRALAQSAEERAARNEALRAQRDARIAQAEAVARAGAGAPALFKEAFSVPPPPLPGDVSQDIVVNPVAGTVSVLATERQHELVQQYLDSVLLAVQRQVLIEATIVEVRLSDAYQAGINWSRLPITGGMSLSQTLLGGFGTGLTQSGNNAFVAEYTNPDSPIGNISGTVKLLEEFGNTRVLSSPKLMALNNQTALLKVVNNVVYFEVSSTTTTPVQGGATTSVNTTAKTVSVGVVMGVTPQINENGRVTLTVRPTVSRVVGFKQDPNPTISVQNLVPEIQVQEMESVLQVGTGQTVVLGGLMQDQNSQNREQIPGADLLGAVGDIFRFRDNSARKTELVIFLRSTVISNPSLDSDELKFFQRFLPQPPQNG
ncbi:MAG: pilus (MSHA type) biogenesis protein MshL [Betaproteobacteria bacterium]|nr:MAG: pilus (MSHA type) biogenesis protein MshL [Betaproteobacteria bacterium]